MQLISTDLSNISSGKRISFETVVTSNCVREYGSVVITFDDPDITGEYLGPSKSSNAISVKSGNGSNAKFPELSTSLQVIS